MAAQSDGGSFSSFDALKKKLGGGDDASKEAEPKAGGPDSPGADKGWTLETDDGFLDEDEIDVPVDAAVRERVNRRPPAFAAMDTGPTCYHSVESEEMELLSSFHVRSVFPEDVQSEVNGLPEDPQESDFEGRVDRRGEMIFTIDGDDAKDYDDAIGIKELGDGRVELGVHIADVGHYVRPETALDAEALARATSIYLPDQVIPMLPEKISNHLCSLVPHRDRLAFSVIMVFNEKGERESATLEKSVINSKQRNTYRIVQDLLDNVKSEETAEIAHLEPDLRLFETWTKKQQAIRSAKGSLRMDSRERKFVFDEKGEIQEIVDAPRYFSMTLIEETALAANQAVGDFFRKRGLPTIYRVHPEKDPDEIEAVAKMLEKFGIRVPKKDRLTGRDIGRMIRAARRKNNAEALIMRIMGLIERAVYEVHDHTADSGEVAKHFGLAREAYLHFTSPIRRYPDLIVHRWGHAVASRGAEAEEELRSGALVDDLNDMATHSSAQSELAEMVSVAVGDLKVCQYMDPHIGEKLDAKLIRVSRYGLDINLPQYNVSGFLPARSIGDRIDVKGATATIRAGKRHFSFSEGQAISVVLKDVDFLRLQLLFELA